MLEIPSSEKTPWVMTPFFGGGGGVKSLAPFFGQKLCRKSVCRRGQKKITCLTSGKKKANKHKHFRWDGVRDKQEPSLGQMGPLPGTKWDPSLGQTGLSLFNSTVKSPFCPVCPWDGWGFVPGTIVPQGPSEKCLCVFCLLVVFFAPITFIPDDLFKVTLCVFVYARGVLGESILNLPSKMTLPN